MDTQELDDLNEDGDEVTDYRARARAELDRIARQTKQMLAEHMINLDIFFLIPNSGESVLLYGTPADPDDLLWERVSNIVSAVVREAVGLDGTRCRPVMCRTTTDAVADNEHSPSLISTPTLQNMGAEQ